MSRDNRGVEHDPKHSQASQANRDRHESRASSRHEGERRAEDSRAQREARREYNASDRGQGGGVN